MSATPPFPATAQTATGEETAKNEHTTEEAEGFRISMTPARERNLWLMDPAAYSEIEETVKQLKNSTSWFSTPEGSAPISTKPEGKEYTSHALLLADRQKQVRSTLEPRQKFDNPCLASHSVGWSSDNVCCSVTFIWANPTKRSETCPDALSGRGEEAILLHTRVTNDKVLPQYGVHKVLPCSEVRPLGSLGSPRLHRTHQPLPNLFPLYLLKFYVHLYFPPICMVVQLTVPELCSRCVWTSSKLALNSLTCI
eukprot:GHVS01078114.1.p1 GENE.GHVS01078114.1~~GHVS01078114.1.p1  ORF type:complete len:269 (-),score=26.08 GHVS01078114.1:29-787(-)